jgi:hypothetical protein
MFTTPPRKSPQGSSSAPLGTPQLLLSGFELFVDGQQFDFGLLHVNLSLVDIRVARVLPSREQFDLGLFDSSSGRRRLKGP